MARVLVASFGPVTNTDPVADLEKWAEGLEQRVQQFGRLQEELGATTATESSPDGVVRVTVDSTGVPTDLYFAESSRGTDPACLAAEVMATMRRAQAKLTQRVGDLVHDLIPDGDEAGQNIMAGYHRRFPDEPVRRPVVRDHEDGGAGVFDD